MAKKPLHWSLQHLQVAVDFAQTDLPPKTYSELAAIQEYLEDLFAVLPEGPGYKVRLTAIPTVARSPSKRRPLSATELRTLQDSAFSLLRSFVTTGVVHVEMSLKFWLVGKRGTKKEWNTFTVPSGSARDLLLYNLIRLLEEHGHRLRVCKAEGCGRLFVKVTKKEFCSARCQSRMYMREYRA